MNIIPILPEIIVFVTAILVLFAEYRYVKLSIVGLIISAITSVLLFRSNAAVFSLTYTIDPFSTFFKLASLIVGIIVILLSSDYVKNYIKKNISEFYVLILFAVLAMMLITSSSNLITIFVSLEFLGLTSYVLAGYLKGDKKSAESSIKYLLFGIVSSAVMLYGMSFLYGITSSLNIYDIAGSLQIIPYSPLLYLSILLIFVGMGFKIAAVPFHLWMPDVFEGSPTPVVAFLSVGPKIAGFAVLVRFLIVALAPFYLEWQMLIAVFSVITMTLGNLVALQQKNIKRMLAYSGISQVGYILIGLVSTSSELAIPSILFYLFVYLFMNLGAFAVIIAVGKDWIEDYAGLSVVSPFLAIMLTIFFLSLAGIPPLAGFVAKFYIFAAAIQSGYVWLAVVAIINTVISVYYYMNVTRVMYFVKSAETQTIMIPNMLKLAIVATFAAIILIGIYPTALFAVTDIAKEILF